LHDEVHVTSLFVTHDQEEAFEVAGQVIVLNKGRVEQMGPPQRDRSRDGWNNSRGEYEKWHALCECAASLRFVPQTFQAKAVNL
jgi:ABC-type molybdate transport system ATPase subunit